LEGKIAESPRPKIPRNALAKRQSTILPLYIPRCRQNLNQNLTNKLLVFFQPGPSHRNSWHLTAEQRCIRSTISEENKGRKLFRQNMLDYVSDPALIIILKAFSLKFFCCKADNMCKHLPLAGKGNRA
jgi:hypothetical protein